MALGLGEIGSLLHEGECFSKVLELEGPLNTSRFFLNAPFGRLTLMSSDILGGKRRYAATARRAGFAARDEASRAIGTSLRRGPHLAPSKQRLEVVGGVPVVVKFPLSLPVRPIVVALTVEAGSITNLVFGDVGPKAAEAGI